MKFCLGNTKIGAKYGSVSALCFNMDATRLLCGYAKGEVHTAYFLMKIFFLYLELKKSF